MPSTPDQDATQGANERETLEGRNFGLQEQLGHRDQDPMIKGADSDFPEPGESPEHTGCAEKKTA